MAQYFDSGSGLRTDCLGTWCETHITQQIQSFRAQFGYYRYQALSGFAKEVQRVALAGNPVHMVLGSNSGSLSTEDLTDTLNLLGGGADTSLIVVSYSDVEFHPKVLHLTHQDGSSKAIVGPANFTPSGLGGNVEAFVDFHDQVDDAVMIQSIAKSIDDWQTRVGQSVFQVRSAADITSLEADKIINQPQPRRTRSLPTAITIPGTPVIRRVISRGRLWRPPVRLKNRGTGYRPIAIAPQPSPPTANPLRWCKRLASSDVQQVGGNTNATGKLRLSQAGFGVDHIIYFRFTFFDNVSWAQALRRGKAYDEAVIDFNVSIRGVQYGNMPLLVDYAPHREAGQRNVTTTVGWGTVLNTLFGKQSYVDDWVIIERKGNGTFELRIEQIKPIWAP